MRCSWSRKYHWLSSGALLFHCYCSRQSVKCFKCCSNCSADNLCHYFDFLPQCLVSFLFLINFEETSIHLAVFWSSKWMPYLKRLLRTLFSICCRVDHTCSSKPIPHGSFAWNLNLDQKRQLWHPVRCGTKYQGICKEGQKLSPHCTPYDTERMMSILMQMQMVVVSQPLTTLMQSDAWPNFFFSLHTLLVQTA